MKPSKNFFVVFFIIILSCSLLFFLTYRPVYGLIYSDSQTCLGFAKKPVINGVTISYKMCYGLLSSSIGGTALGHFVLGEEYNTKCYGISRKDVNSYYKRCYGFSGGYFIE